LDGALEVLQWVQRIAFTALALISFRLWRRHHSAAAAWAALAFGSLAAIVLVTVFTGPEARGVPDWFVKILIAVILVFPYLLFRFAAAFVRPPRWLEWLGGGLTAALILWTFLLPPFPEPGTPLTGVLRTYSIGIVVQWTVLSMWVSIRLGFAGRRQPTLPRRRLRLLAAAAFGLNVSVVVSGSVSNTRAAGILVVQQLLGLVAAAFFAIALDPPGSLRATWRRREEHTLREAAVAVSGATSLGEVAWALLPHIAPIFGGDGAVLVGRDGEVLGSIGMDPAEVARVAALGAPEGMRIQPGLMTMALRNGWLAVKASEYSPFFGREEAGLLESIGGFVDLAVERAALFESERRARQEVERSNEELESFLYSVSHDLKSPLVSLSGYLGYLQEDFGEAVGAQGREYLTRMSANAAYMESLIQDLLELSRVNRVETDPAEVDLGELVGSIADEISHNHEQITVEVGPLPTVWMNPVRARQLFTNLLDNAVQHGGRPDVRIRVCAEETPGGSVELSVADDGCGVEEPYRERVFGVFERLEGPGAEGTGIGLSICRKIADQLGGRIWIADSSRGTDIRIDVPARTVLGWKAGARR
jgi:signal transduction histidine kinase